MKNKHLALAAAAIVAMLHGPADAAVVESTDSGFAIEETTHIAATPDEVYAALIKPGRWWNSDHTFSHNAANLSLDAHAGGCFCEKLPHGGSVQHQIVVRADPGHALGMRGALGPFQAQGVDGSLLFTLTEKDGGTDLVLDNVMGGFMKGGFGKWPAAADGMLGDLVGHLKFFCETGKRSGE